MPDFVPKEARVYGPYCRRDGRAHVIHYWRSEAGAHRVTESYPRYLWRMNIGSIPDGYEVDHIDGDKANNALANLQLLSRAANRRKMPLDKLNRKAA